MSTPVEKEVEKQTSNNANVVAGKSSTSGSATSTLSKVARPNSASVDVKIDHTSPEWRCAVCHIACTQQCSLCKEVAYCGKTHQREDWPMHKLHCRGNAPQAEGKCKIIYDYDTKGVRRGRKLIASKAMMAGELILREKPLVWVPKHDVNPQPLKLESIEPAPEDKDTSACIVCGVLMAEGMTRNCSMCRWPVCSEKCEKDATHAAECKVFQGNHIPRHIQQLLPNRFLFVLRCLLLPSNDPKRWRQLMELEYNPEEMTKKYSPTDMFSPESKDDLEGNRHTNSTKYDVGITKLLKYYGIKCELDWVTHLMKVIKWNVLYDYDDDSRAMLFHMSSAANHSCLPNAELIYKKADGMMFVRCLLDLKPGEKITVSRDPLALMLTAQIRQRRLKYMTGWDGFRCNCARCSDWTELGTHFATLQCRKELKNWGSQASVTDPSPCSGTLSATRPLDQNFEWKCAICKFKISGDLTEDKLGMRNLLTQVFHFADADASYISSGIQTVDSFKFWFHPNHSFIYQTKMRILDTINLLCVQAIKGNPKLLEDSKNLDNIEVEGFTTLGTVQKLLTYGTECLKIADSIFPGQSRIRGHIFHFMGWAKWTIFKIGRQQNPDASPQSDFIQFVDYQPLEEARKYFADAQKILFFLKDVKDDEGYMVKFAYNMTRRIIQILANK